MMQEIFRLNSEWSEKIPESFRRTEKALQSKKIYANISRI